MVKLEIETHSGKKIQTEVENFDAVALNDQLNNNEIITVVIGDKIFSRIDIKFVGEIETIE